MYAKASLGLLEGEVGDVDLGRALLHQVIDSEHPELAHGARINLGYVEAKAGNFDLARELYQKAIDEGPPEVARIAADLLARLDADT